MLNMMPDITTTYMGLPIRSPVIASSSGITDNVANLKQLQDFGVGAVVLKSLFEEEIIAELERSETQMQRSGYTFPDLAEMEDLLPTESGVADYLELIAGAKRELDVPVIASVNCITAQKWTHFAQTIEQQGADGLELNVFLMPSDFLAESAIAFEKTYFNIIQMVLDQVSIPVSVKLSHYFTLLARTLKTISETGISGLVLFNRFFSPDYNIDDLSIIPTNVLSSPSDLAVSLRWIAIMHGHVSCDLAASTGVHDGDGVIKQLLAGAQAVQIASCLYREGLEAVRNMNERLTSWMQSKGYDRINQFRGRLSQVNVRNPAAYDRVQFVKNFRAME